MAHGKLLALTVFVVLFLIEVKKNQYKFNAVKFLNQHFSPILA